MFYVVRYFYEEEWNIEIFLAETQANEFANGKVATVYRMDHIYYLESKVEHIGWDDVFENYFSSKEKAKAYLAAHPEQTVSVFLLLKPPIDEIAEIKEVEETF